MRSHLSSLFKSATQRPRLGAQPTITLFPSIVAKRSVAAYVELDACNHASERSVSKFGSQRLKEAESRRGSWDLHLEFVSLKSLPIHFAAYKLPVLPQPPSCVES